MKSVKDKNNFLDVKKLKFRPMPNDYNPGEAKDIRIGAEQLMK